MDNRTQATVDWAYHWLDQPKHNYINGCWVAGENQSVWPVVNPANQQTLCTLALANEAQAESAADAAYQCHRTGDWRKMNRADRAQVLRQIATLIRDNNDKLSVLETLPNGKLLSESRTDDIPTCADIFEYYAGWTDKFYGEVSPVDTDYINFSQKEPLGACALIAPWNFPLYQAALKMAPALAMGNTVILKPSEYTPLSALYLFELIDEHLNLPQGVINLLLATGPVANALTLNAQIQKVSFTGSTNTGRRIVQNSGASNLKSVTLELGGKSPCIFFDDTPDLDQAVECAFTAMFSHKGEKCSEPTRFLIQRSIYDVVLEKLIAKARAIRCGDPMDADSQQGPQCHKAQFDKIMEYIDIGKQEAELVVGGIQDTRGDNAKGWYVRPTIFSHVPQNARIAQEEIFGPVLSCMVFDTEDEAIDIANATEYGLAAGVYTADIKRAHRMAEQLDAGMVFLNRYGCYGLSSPFGGFKQSGWGKEMAVHSLSSYTKTKSIWIYHGSQ